MSRLILAIAFLLLAVGTAAIGQPAPNKPANGATGQPVDVTIGWRQLSAILAYEAQFSTDSTFADYDLIYTEKGEADLINLDYQTTYFWRVRGVDNNNEPSTEWSATQSFSVMPSRGIPQPELPEDGATDRELTVLLQWSSVDGASGYDVEWASSSSFANAQSANESGTTHTLSGLGYEEEIFWRVRTAAVGAAPGPWSRFASFSTRFREPDPLSAPRLLSPGNNATDQPMSVTLVWGDVPGKDVRYRVEISPEPEFNEVLPESGVVDSTIRTLLSLEPGTTYFWRAMAFNDETKSPWSDPFRFSTGKDSTTFLYAPTLLTPIDGSKELPGDPLLTWDSVEGAVGYEIQVGLKDDFSDLDTLPSLYTESTSLQMTGLTQGTVFHWRVRASDGETVSDWSKPFTFGVAGTELQLPGGITLLSPIDGTENLFSPVELVWTSSKNAAQYHLQLSTTGEFEGEETDLSGFDTVLILDELEEGQRYYWRAQGMNESGEGEWSERWSFVIDKEKLPLPTVPFLIAPADQATDLEGPVKLVWSTSANAAGYAVEYSTTGEFGGEQTALSRTDTSATITAFAEGTRYYWRAKGVNTSGESDWSETRWFTMKKASTGVRNEAALEAGVSVFPVPATDRLTVEIGGGLSGPFVVGLFDASGKEAGRIDRYDAQGGNRRITFDLSGMASGIYYCRISSAEGAVTRTVPVVR